MTGTVPLKYLVNATRPITYGIVQAGPDTAGGVPYIRPVDMTSSQGVPDPGALQRTTASIAAAYRRSTVAEGDIVVSIGPSYGKIMVVPTSLAGANLTQGTARVAPAPGVDARFLYWALQSQLARQHWDVSVGGATFRALNLEPLARTPVPLLPYNEQRRIADFLDDQVALLDHAIDLRQQQIALLHERFRSEMEVEVSLGAVQSAPLVKAAHVLKVQPGYAFSSDDFDQTGGPRLLRGVNVGVGSLDWHDTVRWSRVVPDIERRFALQSGDVVMGMDRPWISTGFRLARVTADDLPSLLLQRVARLVPGEELESDYMYWAFQSERFRLAVESDLTGLSIPHLSGEQIAGFRLRLPSRSQQKEIAVRLDEDGAALRRVRQVMNASIALLRERKQALITAAVTGAFDVTTARRVSASV